MCASTVGKGWWQSNVHSHPRPHPHPHLHPHPRLVAIFLVTQHFLACGYWKVAMETCSKVFECEGMFTNSTGHPLVPCGWEYCEFAPRPEFEPICPTAGEACDDNKVTFERYIVALHWSILASQAGVDNKGVELTHTWHHVYTSLCTMVGLIVDAVLIGSIAQVLSALGARKRAQQDHTDKVNQAMRHHMAPLPLKNAIRDYNKYLWDNGHASEEVDEHAELFQDLPKTLKSKLELCKKKNLINAVPLLQAISGNRGKAEFIQKLELSIVMPGERVIHQGELCGPNSNIFFLVRGAVNVYDENTEGAIYLTTLKVTTTTAPIAPVPPPKTHTLQRVNANNHHYKGGLLLRRDRTARRA